MYYVISIIYLIFAKRIKNNRLKSGYLAFGSTAGRVQNFEWGRMRNEMFLSERELHFRIEFKVINIRNQYIWMSIKKPLKKAVKSAG